MACILKSDKIVLQGFVGTSFLWACGSAHLFRQHNTVKSTDFDKKSVDFPFLQSFGLAHLFCQHKTGIDKFRQGICRFFFTDLSISVSFLPTHDRKMLLSCPL